MRRTPSPRWIPLVMALLAFALRLYWLGAWELSFDEVASFTIARRPLPEMLAYLQRAIREHPPLYYLLLSAWIDLAGHTEFALRFLSALIGTVTVATLYRCVASWIGRGVALVATLLLALSPAHIWASQTARMYALVVLLSLLSIHFFWRLLRTGKGGDWLGFALVTGAGLATHYYFAFVVLAENGLLLLMGRRCRHLWGRWVALHGAVAALLGLWLLGAGPKSTLLGILHHGPAGELRWEQLIAVLNQVAFGPYRHLDPVGLLLLGALAALGVVELARGRLWRGLGIHGALLTALWLLVPPVVLLALPVLMEGRYVIGMVLPLYLAVAAAVVWLRSRWWPAALLLLTAVLIPTTASLPELYHDRFGTYRARVERLREEALPGEPLILNGPWQGLLLTYYDPGELELIRIPPAAPPGIDPAEAERTLEDLLSRARRVWVSYDSLDATDPDRFVARWLYEHAHQVMEEGGLTLYYRAPAPGLPVAAERPSPPHFSLPVRVYLPMVSVEGARYEVVRDEGSLFGGVLRLRRVGVAARRVESGDAVLVALEWEPLEDLERAVRMQLDLVGEDGWTWASYVFSPAPFGLPAAPWPAGEVRLERRGVRVPVGTPPGRYIVRLKVFGPDGDLLSTPDGEEVAVASVEVVPSTTVQDVGWVRSVRPLASFEGLELLRCRPYGDRFSPGHPLPFTCYWRATASLTGTYSVAFRFVTDGGEVVREAEEALSARCPPVQWVSGQVIATPYGPRIPSDLRAGRYRLDLEVRHGGQPLGGPVSLFPFEVKAWPAVYHLPPVEHRVEAVFGEGIRLRGYDLEREEERLRLTLYWQADRRPEADYFVLVHLGLPDAPPVVQADGVPGAWLRPTTTWRPREVIADPHEIPLEGVPPGRYGLYVGLYDPQTGQRLAAAAAGTPLPDGRLLLETVEVEP